MKNLKFWTHRGGRFYNQGHVDFVGFGNIEDDTDLEKMFYNEEDNTWYEANGNPLDYQFNEDGTGYINIDNEYDTTTCVKADSLNEKQLNAILRRDQSTWLNEEELRSIIEEYYPDSVDEIEF